MDQRTGVIILPIWRAPACRGGIIGSSGGARGYASIEYDLGKGMRAPRRHAEALLCRLTGAEEAVVVNNNAAATLIVLAALAAGARSSSRAGELVEIAVGFRVPDVMAQSGASLREVGTTNRTVRPIYGAAINERHRADPSRPPLKF